MNVNKQPKVKSLISVDNDRKEYELSKFPGTVEHTYDSVNNTLYIDPIGKSNEYLEPISQKNGGQNTSKLLPVKTSHKTKKESKPTNLLPVKTPVSVKKADKRKTNNLLPLTEKEEIITHSSPTTCRCIAFAIVLVSCYCVLAIFITAAITASVVMSWCSPSYDTYGEETNPTERNNGDIGVTCNRNSGNGRNDSSVYAMVFLHNYGKADIELVIASRSSHNIIHPFQNTSALYKSPTVERWKFYNNRLLMPFNQVTQNGIYIPALPDSLVVGFNTFNRPNNGKFDCCSTDAFNVIPTKDLGQEYVAITLSSNNDFVHLIGVVALYNNTNVTFLLNTTQGIFFPISVTLNSLETYQMTRYYDMTGSLVRSDKPISVFSGDECGSIRNAGCSHHMENLPKISDLGKHYIVPPFQNSTLSFVKIVPTKPNTSISITSLGKTTTRVTSKYIFESVNVDATTLISATSPVLVASYGTFNNQFYFMSLIPPVCQFSNNFVLVTPSFKQFENLCSVVVENKYAKGLLLNNRRLTNTKTEEQTFNFRKRRWRVIIFQLTDGASTLQHPDKTVKFSFIQYGVDSEERRDNYGFPSRFAFNRAGQKCGI